jgi:Ca2+-dependent lipid-binding protein
VAFINEPHLDLEFTDAAHIANLGVIDRLVRKIIMCIVSNMAILPNRFLLKLDSANDYFKTYQHPLGVLRLTVESGENFGQEKESKNFLKRLVHDVPDCFVKLKLSAEPEWRTATVKNNRHPEWNETHDVLVTDHEQILETEVQDADTATGDDDMGLGSISVKNLLLEGGRHELALTHKGQLTGGKLTIRGEFHQFVPDATSFTSGGDAGGGQILGLMSVLIASVRNLSGSRHELKPSVRVIWGDSVWQTVIKSDCPGSDIENPGFDQTFKIPILAGMIPGPPVKIVLMNGADDEKGEVEVSLDEVLGLPNLALQRDFDVGNGVTVQAGIWLRGTTLAQ